MNTNTKEMVSKLEEREEFIFHREWWLGCLGKRSMTERMLYLETMMNYAFFGMIPNCSQSFIPNVTDRDEEVMNEAFQMCRKQIDTENTVDGRTTSRKKRGRPSRDTDKEDTDGRVIQSELLGLGNKTQNSADSDKSETKIAEMITEETASISAQPPPPILSAVSSIPSPSQPTTVVTKEDEKDSLQFAERLNVNEMVDSTRPIRCETITELKEWVKKFMKIGRLTYPPPSSLTERDYTEMFDLLSVADWQYCKEPITFSTFIRAVNYTYSQLVKSRKAQMEQERESNSNMIDKRPGEFEDMMRRLRRERGQDDD